MGKLPSRDSLDSETLGTLIFTFFCNDISNANKMSVNASKTKHIIFRTQNKPVDPLICNIVYNSTELGLPDDPALISPIDRISFNNAESSFKLLGVLFD
jgi:hypothetical protein